MTGENILPPASLGLLLTLSGMGWVPEVYASKEILPP